MMKKIVARPAGKFRRKPLAILISAACLQWASAPANAAGCDPAVSGTITISTATDATCNVGAGESLQITSAGSILLANQFGNTVSVADGVAAISIDNAGIINSPYSGGNPDFDAIRIGVGASLANGFVNSGTITANASGFVLDGATLSAGIHNTSTGSIAADNFAGGSISLRNNAVLSGGLLNDGAILGAHGLDLVSSTFNGDIHNTSTAQLGDPNAFGFGVLTQNSEVNGNLLNEGAIDGGEGAVVFFGTDVIGNITNSATGDIHGGYGVRLSGVSELTGIISNAGTLYGDDGGLYVEASTVNGTITNAASGNIDGNYGIRFLSGSQLNGDINNAGTINGDNGGIRIQASTLTGTITNTGTIESRFNGAIYIDSVSTLTGNIDNQASGVIDGGEAAGINVTGTSNVTGSILNAGTITAGFNSSETVRVDASTIGGVINNSGVISNTDSGYGINVTNGSTISAITNSGTLIADDNIALRIDDSAVSNGITNSNTISGRYGIELTTASTLSGSITNAAGGSILGDQYGIAAFDSTLNGNIDNSGLIDGLVAIWIRNTALTGDIINRAGASITDAISGYAIYISDGSTAGNITNSGIVSGTNGIGIRESAVGTITNNASGTITATAVGVLIDTDAASGTLENNGTIAAPIAIQINNPATAVVINNTGTLDGAVELGAQTLNLNGTTGRVTGAVSGAGSTVNVNGTFTSENSFDVGTFNVNSGGVFNALNPVAASNGANNAGTISVVDAHPFTITGNYTQTAAGTYRMDASTPTNYGRMTVTGSATLAPLTHIDVDVKQGATLIPNGVLPSVITAGSLSASTFTVTDNSILFNFTGVVNGNAVDLNVLPGTTVYESVIENENFPGSGAARVLDSLIQGTPTGDMAMVISALGSLSTTQEVSNAVQQTLPLLTGGTAQAISNSLDVVSKIVQARQESNLGLSSGEDFLSEKAFWLKPFGSWTNQSERKGVPGYDADTGGLVGGADGVLSETSRLGFAVAYARTSVDSRSAVAPQSADIDSYAAIVYGTYSMADRTDFNYQLDIGRNETEGDRVINFGGLARRARADYSGWSGHVGAGVGHLYSLTDTTTITPSVRLDYLAIKSESYTEKGAGALNLDVDDQTTDQLILSVDGKLNHKFRENWSFTANLGAGYDTLQEETSITTNYVGGGGAFITDGLDPSPWILHGGLGVVMNGANGLEVTARYDVETRPSEFDSHTVSVKVRMPF